MCPPSRAICVWLGRNKKWLRPWYFVVVGEFVASACGVCRSGLCVGLWWVYVVFPRLLVVFGVVWVGLCLGTTGFPMALAIRGGGCPRAVGGNDGVARRLVVAGAFETSALSFISENSILPNALI